MNVIVADLSVEAVAREPLVINHITGNTAISRLLEKSAVCKNQVGYGENPDANLHMLTERRRTAATGSGHNAA